MLNPEDRRAIEGLFSRLDEVERRTPDRDAEAEQLIRAELSRQPGAPYYMAQTILVQEHALLVAERRIQELEAEAERGQRGGFLGGLFDDGRNQRQRQTQPVEQRGTRGPWDRDDGNAGRGGGGFLAGAAQTALGVAGGIMLGNAIGSMFGAGSAHAAEPSPADTSTDTPADAASDTDSDFGDFDGGDGGFDVGGDF